MTFDGEDLRKIGARQRRRIIGKDMAMIFQEPMSSLNPCFTVGFQIKEALRLHLGLDRPARHKRAIELFEMVGIPAPEQRLGTFPHQMSGGMNQRVMIAMAIACKPKLLIADEPTTALDVTIQAQILDLLADLQKDTGMALILITHDMGVVAETAERVSVQYAGQKVEEQPVDDLFSTPHHPYTAALLAALPERATTQTLADDPRRGARPVRPTRRLPLFAPLPVCRRQVPHRSAETAIRCAGAGPLSLSSGGNRGGFAHDRPRRRRQEPQPALRGPQRPVQQNRMSFALCPKPASPCIPARRLRLSAKAAAASRRWPG